MFFRRVLSALLAALFVAGLASCSSVDTATTLNGEKLTVDDSVNVAHINAYAWGVYFLGIPLVCGSASHPGSCVFFTDSLTPDNISAMATKKAKELGASRVCDLKTSRDSSTTFLFLILTYCVFSVKDIQACGNAVK